MRTVIDWAVIIYNIYNVELLQRFVQTYLNGIYLYILILSTLDPCKLKYNID